MKVIGPIVFGRDDVKALLNRSSILLPRDAWASAARYHPCAGDLFWVQEPFVEYEDKKHPWQNDIAYGDPTICVRPDWFKKHPPHHVRFRQARCMVRNQSRFTLEMISITDDRSMRCWVIVEQVNHYARRVAA